MEIVIGVILLVGAFALGHNAADQEALRLAVALIKQFTHVLQHSEKSRIGVADDRRRHGQDHLRGFVECRHGTGICNCP